MKNICARVILTLTFIQAPSAPPAKAEDMEVPPTCKNLDKMPPHPDGRVAFSFMQVEQLCMVEKAIAHLLKTKKDPAERENLEILLADVRREKELWLGAYLAMYNAFSDPEFHEKINVAKE